MDIKKHYDIYYGYFKPYFYVDRILTTSYNISMLNEELAELGLSNKEVALYLVVLQKGAMDVPEAARLTKIKRTTIYSVAKDLQTKGLLTLDLGSRPNKIIPRPPQDLKNLAEKRKRDFEGSQNLVDKVVPQLLSLSKDSAFSVPRIKFIPEVDLNKYLHDQTPKWDKSLDTSDKTWWGFQDPTFVSEFGDWIKWYWERPESEKYTTKIITNTKEKKLKWTSRRQAIHWDPEIDFTAATWVIGNYIIIIYTQKPHYLIEINDKIMADNFRELFKGIWKNEGQKP
jgi:hypothetical protein